ncbi:MAG: heme biosynthesis protein HemY [Rhodobacteraceae bacterium]|nr:heme biosynthesis protein HemY [Paracoccaceae bacterium]
MLWSLIKLLIFIGIVGGLIYGAEQLLATGEGIRIAVLNTEFTLGPIQSVLAALALCAAVWLLMKIVGLIVATLRFVLGDETALTRYFSRNRERRGYRALSDALIALSAGETREAMAKAGKAEALLKRPELTNLIAAQAAEQSGDATRAQEVYKRMLADDRTRFVGVRGLMKQKLDAGDTEVAMKLAEKAVALKPGNAETSETLFHLQAQKDDWTGARRTLGTELKYGTMPRDVCRRRDAVLALADASGKMESDASAAEDAAIEANRLAPNFVPAAVAAARAFVARGKIRPATKALKTAWTNEPHPDLAAAFAEIAPEETPAERVTRFSELTRINPDHPETKMLLAELNIAAEDFPEARRAMGQLADTDPTVRAMTIMAAIERGEGSSDAVVQGWLGRALTVSRGPQWVCSNCSTVHAAFVPVCGTCQGFDTIGWTVKPDSEVMQATSAAGMLPLILGGAKPSDAAPAPEADLQGDGDVVEGAASEAVTSEPGKKQAETA